jgi:hypothetical protein
MSPYVAGDTVLLPFVSYTIQVRKYDDMKLHVLSCTTYIPTYVSTRDKENFNSK